MRKLILLGLILLLIPLVFAQVRETTTTTIVSKTTTTTTTTTTLVNKEFFDSQLLTPSQKTTLENSIMSDVSTKYKISIASIDLQPQLTFKPLNNYFVYSKITLSNGKKYILISKKATYINKYITPIKSEPILKD